MLGIILIGQSNSGKSAIGKAVAERLGIRYISSGDIARNMDTQERLNKGKMAPESEMRSAILDAITSSYKPFILDGFPRFTEQYEWLKYTMDWWNARKYRLVYVYIDVSKKDILARARLRGRNDDRSIRKKMRYFKKNTTPMIHKIEMSNSIYRLDNSNGVDIDKNIDILTDIIRRWIYADSSKI